MIGPIWQTESPFLMVFMTSSTTKAMCKLAPAEIPQNLPVTPSTTGGLNMALTYIQQLPPSSCCVMPGNESTRSLHFQGRPSRASR